MLVRLNQVHQPQISDGGEISVKERGQWGPVNDPNSEDLR